MASFSRQKPLKSKNKNNTIVWNKKFYHCAKFELYRIKDAKFFPSMQLRALSWPGVIIKHKMVSTVSPVLLSFFHSVLRKAKTPEEERDRGKKQHHIVESVSKRAFRLSVFSFGVFTLSKLIQMVSSAYNQSLYLYGMRRSIRKSLDAIHSQILNTSHMQASVYTLSSAFHPCLTDFFGKKGQRPDVDVSRPNKIHRQGKAGSHCLHEKIILCLTRKVEIPLANVQPCLAAFVSSMV